MEGHGGPGVVLYNYDEGKILVLPAEQPLVRLSASDAKVREVVRLGVKPRYREKFAHRGMCMDYERLV